MMFKSSLSVVLVLVGAVAVLGAHSILGGLDNERPADAHIRKLMSNVAVGIKGKYTVTDITDIEPISYRTQLVSGMNYFVKARVTHTNGAKRFIHVRIYKPFEGQAELTGIKIDVNQDDKLEYFQ